LGSAGVLALTLILALILAGVLSGNGRERLVLALDLIAEDIKVYPRTGHR
jgi:hypothetical protein